MKGKPTMPERSLKSRTVRLVLTVKEVGYLDELVRLGLHGEDRNAVVRTLMLRGLQDALRDGLLRKPVNFSIPMTRDIW